MNFANVDALLIHSTLIRILRHAWGEDEEKYVIHRGEEE